MSYRDLKDVQDGVPPSFVKSTFSYDEVNAGEYGVKLAQLALLARDLVRDMDATNDLNFVRLSLQKYEFIVAPDKDYFLIVVQEPEHETQTATKR